MTLLPAIQVYTVRDELARDFEGTLKALAKMGYKAVEMLPDPGPLDPQALARFIQQTGLQVCGWHATPAQILEEEGNLYDYTQALQCPFVTVSLAGMVEKDWHKAIELCARLGKKAREKGVRFSYHNHHQELQKIGDTAALDLLADQTNPTDVYFELDTLWIAKGGEDPAFYMRSKAGRAKQIHIKDGTPEDFDFRPLGMGHLDIPALVQVARDIGAEHLIVEQDACQGPTLEAAEKSLRYLQAENLID